MLHKVQKDFFVKSTLVHIQPFNDIVKVSHLAILVNPILNSDNLLCLDFTPLCSTSALARRL